MKDEIKFPAFDAGDTFLEKENHFPRFEERFYTLVSDFASKQEVSYELFNVEIENFHLPGSMVNIQEG